MLKKIIYIYEFKYIILNKPIQNMEAIEIDNWSRYIKWKSHKNTCKMTTGLISNWIQPWVWWFKLYFDGAWRGNLGREGTWAMIHDNKGKIISWFCFHIEVQTNNEFEELTLQY